jgi:uncharacterized protein YndB with AHSA1/START domain
VSHDRPRERTDDAAPEGVFDAFTNPQAQQELDADAPDQIVQAACDLRVGGRGMITFGPPGGRLAREPNRCQVAARPWRLVYASTMTLPAGSSIDTGMEVTFQEEDDRVRLTIVQSGFPTPKRQDELAGSLVEHPRPPPTRGHAVNAAIMPRTGRREWVGLAVLTLPCRLCAMELTVLHLARPPLSTDLAPSPPRMGPGHRPATRTHRCRRPAGHPHRAAAPESTVASALGRPFSGPRSARFAQQCTQAERPTP